MTAQPFFPPGECVPEPVSGVTISASELATAAGITVEVAERLLPVATAMVIRYAPDAPSVLLNEGVIRVSGWLSGRTATGATSEALEVGAFRSETRHSPSQQGALRFSGAMSLLSPWKQRRAGLIG